MRMWMRSIMGGDGNVMCCYDVGDNSGILRGLMCVVWYEYVRL